MKNCCKTDSFNSTFTKESSYSTLVLQTHCFHLPVWQSPNTKNEMYLSITMPQRWACFTFIHWHLFFLEPNMFQHNYTMKEELTYNVAHWALDILRRGDFRLHLSLYSSCAWPFPSSSSSPGTPSSMCHHVKSQLVCLKIRIK